MGEAKKLALRMEFERKVKLEFCRAKITSNAGLLAYRELVDALDLMATVSEHLEDSRTGKSTVKWTKQS